MVMLIGTAGLLRAIAGPSQGKRQTGQPVTADSRFMTAAAQSGIAELELAALAQEKSTNVRLKGVAQKIEADREKASGELKALASKKSVTLPDAPDAAHQVARDRLHALAGAEFDSAWIARLVQDHEAAVALFSKHAAGGGDPEIRAFAAGNLPALQARLRQVQDLAKTGGSRSRGRR
jgi:putative membrane protein